MSSALAQIPTKYRSNPGVQGLQSALERARSTNRSLRQEASSSVGMAEGAAATLVGAALAGYARGRGVSDGAVGVAAGAVAAAGVILGQPLAVQAAVGALTPLVAQWGEAFGAGHEQAQAA